MNTDYENGVTVVTNGTAPRAEVASTHPTPPVQVIHEPEAEPAAPVQEPAAPAAPASAAQVSPPPAPAPAVAPVVAPQAQEAPPEGSTEEGEGEDEEQGEETPTTPVVRHSQAISLLRLLIELQTLLAGAETAPEPLRSLLAAHGIDSAYLVARRSECEILDSGIATRRQAMADKALAVMQQAQAEAFARKSYSALRKVMRTVVRNPAEKIALGLTERTPYDSALFLATARDTVATAQQEPYVSLLGEATLGGDRLATLTGTLNALAALTQMRLDAEQVALDATRARNAAAAQVRRAARQLRVEIGLILDLHPEISRPVWF